MNHLSNGVFFFHSADEMGFEFRLDEATIKRWNLEGGGAGLIGGGGGAFIGTAFDLFSQLVKDPGLASLSITKPPPPITSGRIHHTYHTRELRQACRWI